MAAASSIGPRLAKQAAPGPELHAAARPARLRRLLPVILLLYSILIPQEARLDIGGQTLYAYRLVCMALLPWLLIRFTRRELHFVYFDGLIAAGCGWMIVSFVAIYGLTPGLPSSLGLVVDVAVPYLVARASITSLSDLRRVLVLFAPGLALAGLAIMIESFAGREIIKPLATSVFGSREQFITAASGEGRFRWGMYRAAGPFAHPILAGLLMASSGALYLTSGLRKWPLYLGVAGLIFSIFTFSSAAVLAVLLVAAAIIYERLGRMMAIFTWPRALIALTLLVLTIQVVSERGFLRFFLRFTFNPATGYYRRLIWDFGTQSVAENPWLGIGFAGFARQAWMNNSVDAYWLSDAMRHGLIVPVCFMLAAILAIRALALRCAAQQTIIDRQTMLGLTVALFVLVLMGFTVAFFGGALLWFYIVLGAAVTLSSYAIAPRPAWASA